MRFARLLLLAVFVAGFFPQLSTSQQVYDGNQNLPPFGSFSGSDFDIVSLQNGNLHLHIPLDSWAQRGGKTESAYFSYDTQSWNLETTSTVVNNVKHYTTTMRFSSGGKVVQPTTWGAWIVSSSSASYVCPAPVGAVQIYRNWSVHDPEGVAHPLNLDTSQQNCLGNVTKSATTDGSGMLVDIGRTPPLLTLKGGSQIILTKIVDYDFIGLTKEDTNGNQVGNTDTLNRPLITTTNGTNYTVFTINDSNGSPQTYRLDNATSVSYQTNFCGGKNNPPLFVCHELSGTRQMPSRLTLPNGTYYQFTWIQGDALELQSVILPTGATINYTYGYLCNQPPLLPGQDALTVALDCRASVTSRTVAGAGASGTWNYSGGTVTDPSGNDEGHVFSIISLNNHKSASTYETEVDSYQGSASSGHLLRRVVTDYTGELNSLDNQWLGNIRPIRKTTTLDNGIVSKTETDYETFTAPAVTTATRLNPTEVREYDYGSGSPGALLRRTDYAYLHNSNSTYANLNIVDRQNSVTTYDGLGNKAAQTTFEYDVYNHTGMPAMGVSGAVQHDSARGTSYVTRGNATAVGRWLNTTGVSLTSLNQYDDAGSVIATKDPKLNLTSFDYTDSWGNSACAPTGPGKAFPTITTNALGQLTKYTYNSCTGTRVSTKDQNDINAGRPGTTYTYDLMNRVLTKTLPDGGQTSMTYNDVPPVSSTSSTKITSSLNLVSTTVLDGLGRPKQSQLTSDPQGTVLTDTTYDALGRKSTVTNPHRNGSLPTDGTTTYGYDALNRITKVTKPDGPIVLTVYTGNCATVADEAGKQTASCADGLGRTGIIGEDTAVLNYLTVYSYDALNNLLTVNQEGGSTNSANWRTRTFTYNSLSQLLTAANPESGTITYTYDSDGNVLTKKDARNITINYLNYDPLNRLGAKSFSDGTESLYYYYDMPPGWMNDSTNVVGRLANTSNSSGGSTDGKATAATFSYDAMGRIVREWEQTPSTSPGGSFVYQSYDLAGDLTSATNAAGVTISYSYDGATRSSIVTSNWGDAQHPATLFTVDPSIGYFPSGAIREATLANGLTESTMYNNRLQPCRMEINSTAAVLAQCTSAVPSGNVLDFTYGYDWGSADNGNVASWSSVGNQTFTRNYGYDSLNRISTFSDTATAQTCKGLSWAIDPWGNRTDQNVTAGTCGTFHAIIGANNRFGSPYQYDAAGNMTYDGIHTYTYDAENHLTQVDAGAAASYIYDPSGNRVRKNSGGSWTEYFYDTAGSVTAEHNSAGWPVEYVYVGGRLVAQYRDSTTYSIFGDHLGSTRLITKLDKSVYDSLDFLPFGEQLAGDTGTTHKFTGKERDTESGLDNFGARFDASNLGRFMSPDPVGGHQEDPQTMNRYSYVRNNPLNLTDPTGLDFYLQCANKNHEGCTQVKIANGLDPTWVQADKNGKANIITSDSIRAGDNTATIDENGVTINGKSQGIYFDNRASQTRDANGAVVDDHNPITLAGSGSLKDFTITLNGNCSGTCLSSGTWSYPGSLEEARVTLYGRHSFSLLGEDDAADMGFGQHAYSTQHRFGGPTCGVFSCADSPHLSVPTEAPDPKMNVPQGFHVDAHGDFYHHSQDVKRQGVE